MGIYKIPQDDRKFLQPNNGEIFGNLYGTRNIDLTTNKGKIRVAPRLKLNTSDTGYPVAFAFFSTSSGQKYWTVAGTKVYRGGAIPSIGFSEESIAGNPAFNYLYSDMVTFNNKLLVSNATSIWSFDGSTTWANWWNTTLGQGNFSGATYSHMLCVGFNGRIYITDLGYKIHNVAKDGTTITLSGSQGALDIGLDQNVVWMRSSSNRLWIGTINNKGREGRVLEWDCESLTYNREYRIGATGSLAGVILDDVPYTMCSDGTLKAFTGSGFKTIAQLPITNSIYLFSNSTETNNNNRWIHPNGMAVVDGKITMVINNKISETTAYTTVLDNMPSGVWEYDSEIGLHHIGQTVLDGTGDLDSGQFSVTYAGAIFETKQTQSRMFVGMGAYSDNVSTELTGIFRDDITSSLPKIGSIITPQLHSSQIEEMWQNTWTRLSPLLNATDKIIVKMRTKKDSDFPQTNNITWIDTSTFTTTDDSFANNVSVGNEVEVIMGTGGGTSAHITVISKVVVGATTTCTVNLDEAITGVTGTGKIMVNNWKKLGTFNTQNISSFKYNLSDASTASWIQFKFELRGLGNSPEIDQFITVSKTQLNIT